jgi:dTDP-4-dehydrorhamnose reductase
MNILVFGSHGQIGWELARSLLPLGHVIAVSREQVDLMDMAALCKTVQSARPTLIVNAAAYTAVDKAEIEIDTAIKINAVAPSILAEEAARIGALLIHYSTDYVFDGNSAKPYTETDATLPLSVYGRSKLAGEQAITASGCDHLILRTSWVYGARGNNFMRTMLRLAREQTSLRVVSDQTGAPTWSRWIADATAQIAFQAQQKRSAQTFASGIYHLTNSGTTTWHGFASEIISGYRQLHPQTPLTVQNIEAITTAEYPTPAHRPANSRLNCERITRDYGIACPDWKDALALCLQELQT